MGQYFKTDFVGSAVVESVNCVSDCLQPHGVQHTRLPCPSLSPGVRSNPCPMSWWRHTTIPLCCPLLLLPSIFPSLRVFSNALALSIGWLFTGLEGMCICLVEYCQFPTLQRGLSISSSIGITCSSCFLEVLPIEDITKFLALAQSNR